MQKGRTRKITVMNGELIKSTLVVIIGSKNFCHNGSWYLEEGNTTDPEDCRKVTNILKELATLST